MATAGNLFEYTATGLLGDQRPSMLENELHLRVKYVMFCSFFRWVLAHFKNTREGSVILLLSVTVMMFRFSHMGQA